jgi:cell wall assembly regulator SMI1
MAREDWISVKIPVLMAESIDRWLASDVAKKNGVFSRPDFLTRLIASYFIHFEKDFGIFVPREVRRNLKGFDVMKPLE